MELRLQSPDAVGLVEALISTGFLQPSAAADRAAICKALERAVEIWILKEAP
jgi:hypothetical protein